MRLETLDETRGSPVTGKPSAPRGVPDGDAAPTGRFRSRRLLHLAGDGRLVEQIRRGNDAAFEIAFERHAPAILAFCRHMLGSPEEAEDAVQHTFASAYRDLRRGGEREIILKPWLFAIARNRCVSLLRKRREIPVDEAGGVSTEALAEHVERRAELRRVVADVRELPDEQRAALLLAELGDLSHAEVAEVLCCEVARVKALVYRARSQLIARRAARETPCEDIRVQLATLRGGALRRSELRLHLRDCPGCRSYRDEVRRQREMLAIALPVVPTAALESSVLAAVGLGGSAGGATTLAGAVGGGLVAKVAVVSALAGGGMVAGEVAIDSGGPSPARPAPVHAAPMPDGAGSAAGAAAGAVKAPGAPSAAGRPGAGRKSGRPTKGRRAPGRDGRRGATGRNGGALPSGDPWANGRRDGSVHPGGGRANGRDGSAHPGAGRANGRDGAAHPGRGRAKGREPSRRGEAPPPDGARGRGPIETPPGTTPVRRGASERAAGPKERENGEAPDGSKGETRHAPASPGKAERPAEPGEGLALRGASGRRSAGGPRQALEPGASERALPEPAGG
jgi:RNA polymerase sigma factor (sigma-70 family)